MVEVHMVKIGLVVPVFKNFTGFAELMETVDSPVVPIVVPNWRNNIGVSAGWNQGLRRAVESGCDLALVCNDDILLAPGTISLLKWSVWNHGADLVTPVNTRDGVVTATAEHNPNPDFACFMVKPEEFRDKFGFFDEGFTPAYFEDNDMHYRMKLSGGSAYARTDAGFYHRGSVTQNWGGQRIVSHEMFRSNEAYYMFKWGGLPGHEQFTLPWNNNNLKVSDW
jgi:GT2 family glycosyltransferase